MWCSSQAAGFSTSGTLARSIIPHQGPNTPLAASVVHAVRHERRPRAPVAARRHPGAARSGRAGRHRLPRPRLATRRLPRCRRLLRRVRLRHHRGAAPRAPADGPHLPARLLGSPRSSHPAARPRRHRRGRGRRPVGLGGGEGGRRAVRRALRHVLRRQLALRGARRRLLRSWLRAVAPAALLVARGRGAVLPGLAAARPARSHPRRGDAPAPRGAGGARGSRRPPVPRLGRRADHLRPDDRLLLHPDPRLGARARRGARHHSGVCRRVWLPPPAQHCRGPVSPPSWPRA